MNKLPSAKLNALLHGETPWDEADAAIKSWAQYFIHQAAVDVLDKPTKEERRETLETLPTFIRPMVESEAKRVWAMTIQSTPGIGSAVSYAAAHYPE